MHGAAEAVSIAGRLYRRAVGFDRRLGVGFGHRHHPRGDGNAVFLEQGGDGRQVVRALLGFPALEDIRAILLEERQATGLSILYTSHNMREMEEMSDRIIFLQRGKIVAEGTAKDIVARFGQADLEDVFLKLAREQ